MFRIKLIDVRFFSKIGVFEEERIEGQNFILNLTIDVASSRFVEEELESTISYADIYQEVKIIMSNEWLLLETVAVQIRNALLKRWPQILRGSISIVKVNPPIEGIEGSCGIDYFF